MQTKENKKIVNHKSLIDEGLGLLSKTQSIIDEFDKNKLYDIHEVNLSFDIVDEYHKWIKNIQQFMDLDLENEIDASIFREADGVPTFDWLDEHHEFNGDYIPIGLAENILRETKKRLEQLREVARKYKESEKFQKNTLKEDAFWVRKNEIGDYLFDGNFVDIKNKESNYVKIFDVVFSLRPNGGDIPYEEIISEGKKRKLKLTKINILRALSGNHSNFFRYVNHIK